MKDLEAEGAENRRTWYFDIEAIFVIDQGKVLDFVYNETLEPVVEYRELRAISDVKDVGKGNTTHCLEPQRRFRNRLTIQQQAGKEQAE